MAANATLSRSSATHVQQLQTPSLSPAAAFALPSSSSTSSSPATSPSSSSSSSSSISRNGAFHKPPQQHHQQNSSSSSRTKAPSGAAGSRRSVTPTTSHPHRAASPSSSHHNKDNADSGRVRIAVRVRPRSAEEVRSDADFADCVELQPELKRLILRKNSWCAESYKFDELFTETASQRRVYEAVAKPVVESVLSGYNGTVMAYGQTGTGKTYTIGRMGKDDVSQRGIMVRSLEDILSSTTSASDIVEISYLQLYMESIQDLLAPEKVNIHINDDPKTGEVSIHGATLVKLHDLDHFLELMRVGEANRHAANTKQNTESSRSHAILVVFVRRSVPEKVEDETGAVPDLPRNGLPRVRKSKMLIVDLAGSERIDKSGSEGLLLEEAKFINLSLTSLGKCINALAENSPHIPTRDSKLTRLLRDSFGGSARTSLIVTIGPSARNHTETSSTIMFGQRAMKIVNMVKLKEEFDYESQSRKLQIQVDQLTAEIEREHKMRVSERHECERQIKEYRDSLKNVATKSEFLEREKNHMEVQIKDILSELDSQNAQNSVLRDRVAQFEMSLKLSQLENSTYQKVLAETTQMYEEKIAEFKKQLENEHASHESAEEELNMMKQLLNDRHTSLKQHEIESSTYQKALTESTKIYDMKIAELNKQLEEERALAASCTEQLDLTNKLLVDCKKSIQKHEAENASFQKALVETAQTYEKKIAELSEQQDDVKARLEGVKSPSDQKHVKQIADESLIKIEEAANHHVGTTAELKSLKSDYEDVLQEKARLDEEVREVKQRLAMEEMQRKSVEHELAKMKKSAPEIDNGYEDKASMKENIGKPSSAHKIPAGLHKSTPLRESVSGQRASIAKMCEEVGLQKILQLLTFDDPDVQIHAVKVVANLASEDINQEKIVEEGGLDALLMLLKSSQNTTILRVASGAIANLAMNDLNQGLIMSKGGAELLADTATRTDDPQTLRMVAGALANLCGNETLHLMLIEDGGIKALLGMAKCGNLDVVAQVARGMANFAKCESRATFQGHRKGRSLLMDQGALEWLMANCNTASASTRRHIELALCHLAQNEGNVKEFASSGGSRELVRISNESAREDIRSLARKTMKMHPHLL
ncbi:Kinesin-like protein KIN-UC [Linum perenne]